MPRGTKKYFLAKSKADEFVAFLGFVDEESFNRVRHKGDLLLEEYLFTGLRHPMGMSYLAGYNQFICTPLSLPGS